jgi:hypothetical protein
MSQIKRTVCDQCGKEEINEMVGKWIAIKAQCDEMGDYTVIHFPDRQIEITDTDFCSKECLIKYILGEPNVIK